MKKVKAASSELAMHLKIFVLTVGVTAIMSQTLYFVSAFADVPEASKQADGDSWSKARKGFQSVALNQTFLDQLNDYYELWLPTGSVENQADSGRCWIFATIGIIRSLSLSAYIQDKPDLLEGIYPELFVAPSVSQEGPVVAHPNGGNVDGVPNAPVHPLKSGDIQPLDPASKSLAQLPRMYRLSETYMYYWELYEKMNRSFRQIEVLGQDLNITKFQKPEYRKIFANAVRGLSDGGEWEFSMQLLELHGMVPKPLMPEKNDSKNSRVMLDQLHELMEDASSAYLNTIADLKNRHAGKKEVAATLAKVTMDYQEKAKKMLDSHLGKPPQRVQFPGVDMSPTEFLTNYLNLNIY